MSGGAYDYAHSRIEYLAEEMVAHGGCFPASPEIRLAFRALLYRVAAAARAIEWNDSGDGANDEEALILKCLPAELIPAKEAS